MPNQYELPVLCLCADMVRSARLRRRFDRNPVQVMREYGLDRADVDAFYTMFSDDGNGAATWKGLWEYMWNKEVKNFTVDKLHPLPEDPDCQGAPVYPNPRPGLFKVDKLTAPSGSTNTEIEIKGQGLSPFAVEVHLENVATQVRTLVFAGKGEGTYRCSHLKGKWDLSATPAANYEIVLINKSMDGTLDREAKFNQPFVVT